jgi:disulfide oxidoreductase YuzD
MAMAKKTVIKWHSEPQKHDYAAAASYLSLILGPRAAKKAAKELERAKIAEFPAKDIFRASMLSLLGVSNSHVERDQAKIIRHDRLSPLLLYRDKANGKLVIADGYHRLCALYKFNEDAMIPCKIVGPD